MNIKEFLFIICSLFAGSALLLVLVRKLARDVADAGKRPMLYGVFAALCGGGISFGSSYLFANLFEAFWLLAFIFLLFGIVHLVLVHKKYFTAHRFNQGKLFTAELLYACAVVMLTVMAFFALQYYIKDKQLYPYPLLISCLAFFVPLLFVHTFQAAFVIPAAHYPTWQYPLHAPIDLPEEDPREQVLVIGFEIAKKATDAQRTYFRARAPEGMKLCDLFYHFVNDYNDQYSETLIAYVDANNEPYEWWFRVKPKWYQRHRILNPLHSFRESGIRENMIIICDRILITPQETLHARPAETLSR